MGVLQMKVNKEVKKTLSFDPERCNDIYIELVEIFQKHKPTVGEILVALGNLSYTLGASVGQFPEKGPGIEELKRLYYSEPGRLDVALMISGITVISWYEDWEKLQVRKSQDTKEKPE